MWKVRLNSHALGTAYVEDEAGAKIAFCQTISDAERIAALESQLAEARARMHAIDKQAYWVDDDDSAQIAIQRIKEIISGDYVPPPASGAKGEGNG